MPCPVDQRFVEITEEIALLKINSNDKDNLKKGSKLMADIDISMKIAYADFLDGSIKVETAVTDPIKMIVWMEPNMRGSDLVCGGAELELSKLPEFMDKCEVTSKEGENGCEAALSDG